MAFPHCYYERRSLYRHGGQRTPCTSTATYRLEADVEDGADLLILLCPDHMVVGLVDLLTDGLSTVRVSLV